MVLLQHYPTLHNFHPLTRTEAIEYYGKSPGISNKSFQQQIHPWNPMHLETEYQGPFNLPFDKSSKPVIGKNLAADKTSPKVIPNSYSYIILLLALLVLAFSTSYYIFTKVVVKGFL
jgi:hypothetical protein